MKYLKEYKDYNLVERITMEDVCNYSLHKMSKFPKNIKDQLEELESPSREIIVSFGNIYIYDETHENVNKLDGMIIDILDTHLGVRGDRKFSINVFLTDDEWYVCSVNLHEWKGSWRMLDLDYDECYKCDSMEGLITFVEDVCLSWSL